MDELNDAGTAISTPEPITPSERPTFAQAFAQDAARQATESHPVTQAPTTPPAEATPPLAGPVVPTTEPGEPPKERWSDILTNARTKTRAEVEAEWQPYAWAKQIPQQHAEAAFRQSQEIATDPVGFTKRLIAELQSHPHYSQQFRSEAARLLASGRSAPDDLEPAIPVVDEQGRMVDRAYSATQVKALIKQAVAEAIGQEVQPLKQSEAERVAQAKADAQHRQNEQYVDALLAEAETWPGFKEHTGDVDAALLAHPEWSFHRAWIDVKDRIIDPEREKTLKAQQLGSLKQQAAAGNSVNPAGAVVATPRKVRSLTDPSLKWG